MRFQSLVCALAFVSVGAAISRAQADVWNGGGGANTNWSDTSNWASGTPVNNGTAQITFTNATAYTSTVDTSFSITNVMVSSTAGALTLNNSGGATLTISSGFFYGGSSPLTVNVPILGAGEFWLNANPGTVTMGGGSGLSTYSGTTEIFGGATLQDTAGTANSFSANSVFYVGGTGGGILNVKSDETIAGLNDGGANGIVKISSGKTLTLTGAFSTTFSGVIQDSGGPGSLTMNGPSTQTLEGANTYTGPTTINSGGGINIGGGGATGSLVSSVSGSGSLSFDLSTGYTYAGVLSGALNVIQSGTGTTTLNGTNTYSGPTTVLHGTLNAGSDSAFGGAGNSDVTVDAGATLGLNGSDDQIGSLAGAGTVALGSNTLIIGNEFAGPTVFSGVLTGSGGSLVMDGYVLVLSGSGNTYSGGTIINAGTIEVDNASGSATGTGPIMIGASGVLQFGNGSSDPKGAISATSAITDNGQIAFFQEAGNYTIANPISGSGGITQNGAGTTILTGDNSFSGTIDIFSGTLRAGASNPNAFGNGQSPVTFDFSGTLDLNGNSLTLGSISGSPSSGGIALGSGTLTLGNSAANTTFGGAITGSGGLVTSQDFLTLTGANTYTGVTQVNSGSTLLLGTGGTTGSLTSNVTGGGTLAFDRSDNYTYAYPLSGGLNLLQVGSGILTLSASNSLTGNIQVEAGTLQAGSTDAFGGNSQTFVQADAGATIDLNNFSNTIGTLSGLVGSSLTLGNATLTIADPSGSAEFSGTISGGGGTLVFEGSQIILSGANTYGGGTDVESGDLIAVNPAGSATGSGPIIIGASGAMTIGQGGSAGAVSAPTIANGGFLTVNLSSDYNLASNISGSGVILQSGTDNLTLSGNNSYSGFLQINSGTVTAGSTTAFGGSSLSPVTLVAGTLDLASFSNTIGSIQANAGSTINIGTGAALTLGGSEQFSPIAGTITGGGALILNGSGSTTDLTNASTYTGGTTVAQGSLLADNPTGSATGSGNITIDSGATLDIGADDAAGSVAAPLITDNGSIEFDRSDSSVFPNPITGSGNVSVVGPGTVTFTGANTYSGDTIITDNGTLVIGDGATLGSITSPNIQGLAGSAVEFDHSDAYTYSGVVSGPMNLVQEGTGTLTLSGANTLSGSTTVNSGTLADGAANAFSATSSMIVNTGGNLAVNFNETVGDLENGEGGGTVSIATGTTLSSNGINNPGPFMGIVSGAGSFSVLGGTQGLGGANTYTGGTVMAGGELFVSGSTVGSPGSISSGPIGTGTLLFAADSEFSNLGSSTLANAIVLTGNLDNDDGTGDLILTGPVSGSGGITWCVNNVLALINSNTSLGGTIDMRDGTLEVGSNTAAGSASITLEAGGLAGYGTGMSYTLSNPINVTGNAFFGNLDNNNLTLTGNINAESNQITYYGGANGTLTLSGNNSGMELDSGFIISSGTVVAASNNAFGSVQVQLTGGAGLNVVNGVTVNNNLNFSGAANVLSGSGTIGSAVTVDSAVVLSPSATLGGGPGNLTFTGPLELATGGAIHFDIYDAAGAPGTGYSLITASGGLNLTASANTLTFNVVSTDASGNAASAINFNPMNPYSWTFASSSSAISGFSAGQFHLVTGGFLNGTAGGTFSVSEVGDNLDLNFTPVPEPSTWALIGSGALAMGLFGIRRRLSARA
jgi:fibronectin-binding autotransporter adhesin